MSVTTSMDWNLATQLVKACIQSQNAFHDDGNLPDLATCHEPRVDPQNPCENKTKPQAPDDYKRIDCFTGVNTYHQKTQAECFGLVYQKDKESGTYIFSFRGSKSQLDWLEDFEFIHQDNFVPLCPDPNLPKVTKDVKVARGFWNIYTDSIHNGISSTPSMQQQLFDLLRKHRPEKLYITGHSLGGALCELFTLDLALSKYRNIEYCNYNYGCPKVGNKNFADLYDARSRENRAPTLRVHNIIDVVPYNPPGPDYAQVGQAYPIGFRPKHVNPDCILLDNHMAQNYAPVLQCASTSPNGVCIDDDVAVPWPTCAVVSFRPDLIQLPPILMESLGVPAVAGINIFNTDLGGCFKRPCVPPCTGPFGG